MFKSLRGMSFSKNVVQTQMVRVLHIYIIYITFLRLLAFAHIMEEFSFSPFPFSFSLNCFKSFLATVPSPSPPFLFFFFFFSYTE